jgi:hypothetical protein
MVKSVTLTGRLTAGCDFSFDRRRADDLVHVGRALPRVGENPTRALQYVAMTGRRESNTGYLYERRGGAAGLSRGSPLATSRYAATR